jgi:hypothetical protein
MRLISAGSLVRAQSGPFFGARAASPAIGFVCGKLTRLGPHILPCDDQTIRQARRPPTTTGKMPVVTDAPAANLIRDIRVIRGFRKRNAGPESIRGRHLVDVQQRLNCALPSHFSELWFLSIPKSSRHVVNSEEFTDLAVDLCFARKIEVRKSKIEKSAKRFLLRKEVIQPQVPLRLPCYDFIPVTAHSVEGCFPCGLARRLRLQATSMM